jgi:hypothetical protein
MSKTLSFKEDVIRIKRRKIATGFSYGERLKPANSNKIFANSGRASFNFVRKYNFGCHGIPYKHSQSFNTWNCQLVCRASMPALGSLLHTPCHLIRHP